MRNSWLIIFIFTFSVSGYSQDSAATFYPEGGKLFLAAGLMYNQPSSSADKNKYIRHNFIPDLNLDVGYLVTNKQHHGWMFVVGCSTKNHYFTLMDKDGGTGSASFEFNNIYAHLTIKKTFDFDLTEKINLLVSAGPVLILNPRIYGSDSQNNYFVQTLELDDMGGFGAAANFGAHLVRKVKNDRFIFLKASYQKGFIDFMEARLTNTTYGVKRTFLYNGTGPAIKSGIIF